MSRQPAPDRAPEPARQEGTQLSFDQLSALVGAIYQGPLEPVPWSGALVMLRDILRANWATLILRPASADQLALIIRAGGQGPEVYHAAYSHYEAFSMDPFVGLPLDQVVTIDEMMSTSWMEGKFYETFLEPNDIRFIMGVDTVTEGGANCRLRITRPPGERDFSEKAKALCQALLPHLRRSVTLHSRIESIETERQLYSSTMDRMLVGTVVFDESGLVLRANAVASAVLAEKDGIRLNQNRLHAEFAAEDRELQRLIKMALTESGAVPVVPQPMTVTRPSGRASLGVLVRPVPSGEWSEERHRPAAVAFIRDPERKWQLSLEMVRQLFGLTGSEAALALLLANGFTLDEAAVELGIRKNTIRAHLRSIFAKTGVRRQTTLIHLLLSSVASIS
ncbi:MAG: helix-turn-helix transcriptional regulator [Steroidobacteraceae bacterium]